MMKSFFKSYVNNENDLQINKYIRKEDTIEIIKYTKKDGVTNLTHYTEQNNGNTYTLKNIVKKMIILHFKIFRKKKIIKYTVNNLSFYQNSYN